MNHQTGRPNEALPGKGGGSGAPDVLQPNFVIALATEAHVNCQRRKNKTDAETYARQDSVWYLARDPRSERGMQEACASSATSTPTPASGAAGQTNGKPAGVFHCHSKRRGGHLDMVVHECDHAEPVTGNRQRF